jgi:hypothetical protein
LVRVEIILRSAWAITATMPTSSSLASGMSAATNRTAAFWSRPGQPRMLHGAHQDFVAWRLRSAR